MHDWWLGLVVSRFGKTGYLDESTMLYRQHGGNSVGAKQVGSLRCILQRLSHLKQVRQAILRKKSQASAFLATYEEKLSQQEMAFLRQFARSHSGFIFFLSNRMLMNSFWMRAGFILLG